MASLARGRQRLASRFHQNQGTEAARSQPCAQAVIETAPWGPYCLKEVSGNHGSIMKISGGTQWPFIQRNVL